MDSKLEAHIDEIFQDVPKTDKMVTMINRIKSKANSKYLQTREQGYSRSVAFNEVDDWLMKAKVIVDEEAGKLTPAEIAAAPMTAPAYVDESEVVSSASTDNGEEAVVVEKAEEPSPYSSFGGNDEASFSFSAAEEPAPEATEEAPVEEAPVEEEEEGGKKKRKKKEKGEKKSKKPKKEEVEEEDIVVPVHPVDKKGKIIGAVLLVAGVVVLLVSALMIVGII